MATELVFSKSPSTTGHSTLILNILRMMKRGRKQLADKAFSSGEPMGDVLFRSSQSGKHSATPHFSATKPKGFHLQEYAERNRSSRRCLRNVTPLSSVIRKP